MKKLLVGTRSRAVMAFTALLATVALVPILSDAGATTTFQFERFAGEDRFETARSIATASFGTAPTVLLARANPGQLDKFADALAGDYLAGAERAPILLTNTERLPDQTRAALADLSASRVIVLGGIDAVSSAVEADLKAQGGIIVERVGGADRFATAAAIARRPGSSSIGTVDGLRTAILTTGRSFPDPLAAGPMSYDRHLPILLSEPDRLPEPSRGTIRDLGIQHVILIGGVEAISAGVEAEVKAIDPTIRTTRLGGLERHETATILADYELDKLAFSNTHVNVARSDDFPDALAGGPHGGRDRAPILLTPTHVAHPTTCRWLQAHAGTLAGGHIFGGVDAVTAQTEAELRACGGVQPATTDNVTVPSPGVGAPGVPLPAPPPPTATVPPTTVVVTAEETLGLTATRTVAIATPPGVGVPAFFVDLGDGLVIEQEGARDLSVTVEAGGSGPVVVDVATVLGGVPGCPHEINQLITVTGAGGAGELKTAVSVRYVTFDASGKESPEIFVLPHTTVFPAEGGSETVSVGVCVNLL